MRHSPVTVGSEQHVVDRKVGAVAQHQGQVGVEELHVCGSGCDCKVFAGAQHRWAAERVCVEPAESWNSLSASVQGHTASTATACFCFCRCRSCRHCCFYSRAHL